MALTAGLALMILTIGAALIPLGSRRPTDTDDRDCRDFFSQRMAQRFFGEEGGPESDPHPLDEDEDGIACESLP
jgi:hypothetical protein